MATAIGFKKVSALPPNPLKSTFYWVGEKDIYYGDKKLNNDEDVSEALQRITALEIASGSSSGGGIGAKLISLEDTAGRFESTNVEDALAELMQKIGAGGSAHTFDDYSVLALEVSDWTSSEEDGGRTWFTASIPFEKHAEGAKLICAVPCGATMAIMTTEQQEKYLYAMKAWLYPDEKIVKFYSPVIPDTVLTVALEGVEFNV